jgi:solute carrier family 25 protein 16
MLGLCAASVAAHTVVAPLDRLKIMQQALGPRSLHDTRWMGLRGIFSLWETEGLRGLWRGHTASLLRIVPLICLNTYLFGLLRPLALHAEQGQTRYPEPLSPVATLLVSGSAGMTAQAIVHPLDLLRAKMCVQTRNCVTTPRFCPDTPGQWAGLGSSVRGVWKRRSERNSYDPTKYDTRSLSEAFREQVRVGGVRGLWRCDLC